ncbi:MAG TPA: hypothetical protein VK175_15900 [Leadbetterella sp.]|nr:hypothetical protein [Leadbetterella sp.]
MNRTNKDIKDQFHFFKELVTVDKIVLKKTIQLEPKKSNAKWLTGQSSIQHQTISDNIIFFVERSKRDSKYGIKLRCPSLTGEPFFRFDSDGPAHRNDFPDIPLEEQSVTTPHFNSYKEDGKPIAYKNETLKKEKDAQIIAEDINFGVSLFCMECNSKLSTGDFPTVIDKAPELEFSAIQNINFDNISFE